MGTKKKTFKKKVTNKKCCSNKAIKKPGLELVDIVAIQIYAGLITSSTPLVGNLAVHTAYKNARLFIEERKRINENRF